MTTSYRQKREGPSRVASAPLYLRPPLKVAWTVPSPEAFIYDLPFIDGGLIYFRESGGTTAARSESTGDVVWEVDASLSLTTGDTGIGWRHGGRVLDLSTGQDVRPFRLQVGMETVLLGQILVSFSFDQGDLFRAGDWSTDKELWEYKPEGPHPSISGIFCADEKAVYGGLWDASVVALDLRDGRALWRQSEAAQRQGQGWGARGFLVVHQGIVIVRFHGSIVGLSTEDGRVVWSALVGGSMDGYLYRDLYYTTTREGKYHVLEPTTGKSVFTADLTETLTKTIQREELRHCAPILVSETHLLVGTERGRIVAFERDTGKYSWSHRPKGSGPISKRGYFASANGRFYYADGSACLYCLEEKKPTDPVLLEQKRMKA